LVVLLACGNETAPPRPPNVTRAADGGTRSEAGATDAPPGGGGPAADGGDPCEQRACNAAVPDLCCPSVCSAATDIDCPGCGNGRMEAGELCDPPDSCPTSCPQLGCEKQRLKSAGTCFAVCAGAGMQDACADGDECCPPGCTAANDRDCTATCGNGTIEPGELCDPPSSCPQSCPRQGCTILGLQGAGTCLARCVETGQQTACASGDGCCPTGCNAANDTDCAIQCGNGVIEGMETCDPLSSCPARCPAQGCRLRRLVNAGTCTAACIDDGIETTCKPGDGCCPTGCNNVNDSDCPVLCGNSVIEGNETCDPIGRCRDQERACVSDAAFVRRRTGDSGRCSFVCMEMRRVCGADDGACPPGCGPTQDHDCPGCGNEVKEPNETCDPCDRDVEACTSDANSIRMPTGSAAMCTFVCMVTPRPCLSGDGFCPGMCTRANDADCLGAPGDPCKLPGECSSERCTDNRCCVESCAVCQSCTGPKGTCVPITKGQPDFEPPNACAGGSVCDGTGKCIPPACELTVRPAALQFPATPILDASQPQSVTVFNACNTDVPQPLVTSTSDEFPVVENTCMGVLGAGKRCLISVRFRPAMLGARTGVLRVGIPGATASAVQLSGQGLTPIPR
jgi:hypothetical protein